jgi:hypothetical protein
LRNHAEYGVVVDVVVNRARNGRKVELGETARATRDSDVEAEGRASAADVANGVAARAHVADPVELTHVPRLNEDAIARGVPPDRELHPICIGNDTPRWRVVAEEGNGIALDAEAVVSSGDAVQVVSLTPIRGESLFELSELEWNRRGGTVGRHDRVLGDRLGLEGRAR